jgi:cytochrome c biogenesis protein CcdA
VSTWCERSCRTPSNAHVPEIEAALGEDLTWAIVLGAAAVDSVNPCAIGVILFLSSALLRVSTDKRALLQLGIVYTATVFVVYTLSGLGLIWFQHLLIERGLAEAVGVTVGALVIGLGLLELKDCFWYGRGPSLEIAPRHKERISRMAGRLSLVGVISIGAFVAMVELPCTGGPYLAITALLARSFDARAMGFLLVYNLVFVLPLLVILVLLYSGAATVRLKRWRQENRKWMNLASGCLMLGLGSFLIAYYRTGWSP